MGARGLKTVKGGPALFVARTFLALRHDRRQHGSVAHEPIPACTFARMMFRGHLWVADLRQFEICLFLLQAQAQPGLHRPLTPACA
jgi:hypothetical protein